MWRRRALPKQLFALATLSLLAACGDDPASAPTPTTLTVVEGASLTGVAGERLSEPLVVQVKDGSGRNMSGVSVTFSVVEGGGTVSPTNATTNSSGEATTRWTLGGTAGTQRVQASVSGIQSPATFTATVSASPAASIAIASGDAQTAPAGQLLAAAPTVRVLDRFQNPVAGASVIFSVIQGGGSITNPGATTDANGIATVEGWRLGNTAGVNRLSALVVSAGVSGNPVVITATGTAGAASTLQANSATSYTPVVGTSVTPAPSVRLVDANGNPVAGAQVTFTASNGSAVTGGTKTTDATGVATVDNWLVGGTAQTYTLTASSGTLTPVVFTAAARAAAASNVAVFAGNSQTVQVGRAVPIEPSVRVVDGFGNPVSGIEVLFDVTGGGGSVVARRQFTNANGVAEVGAWTVGEVPGTNTLRATVTGANINNNPITFTATATAGPPATVSIVTGNGQSSVVGSLLPVNPSVVVRDNRGNPVSNVSVSFIVTSGGGSITPATAVTNAAGVATAGQWRLGNVVGQQQLVARVVGLPDAVFTANATPGTPASVIAASTTALGNIAAGAFVQELPSVLVRDLVGNPVAGATVTFTLDPGSGGQITGAVRTTDANGIATLGTWQMGTTAGPVGRVTATVAGLTITPGEEPEFLATTVAGLPAQIAVAPASVLSQPGVASTAVATPPGVRVTDQFGNAVAGQLVQFFPIDGTVTGSLQTTDANGVATVTSWTLPAGSGTRNLTAVVVSNNTLTVTFSAIVP